MMQLGCGAKQSRLSPLDGEEGTLVQEETTTTPTTTPSKWTTVKKTTVKKKVGRKSKNEKESPVAAGGRHTLKRTCKQEVGTPPASTPAAATASAMLSRSPSSSVSTSPYSTPSSSVDPLRLPDNRALSSGSTKNRDVSSGPLTRRFVHSFAPRICLLRTPRLARSLRCAHSFACSLTLELVEKCVI